MGVLVNLVAETGIRPEGQRTRRDGSRRTGDASARGTINRTGRERIRGASRGWAQQRVAARRGNLRTQVVGNGGGLALSVVGMRPSKTVTILIGRPGAPDSQRHVCRGGGACLFIEGESCAPANFSTARARNPWREQTTLRAGVTGDRVGSPRPVASFISLNIRSVAGAEIRQDCPCQLADRFEGVVFCRHRQQHEARRWKIMRGRFPEPLAENGR